MDVPPSPSIHKVLPDGERGDQGRDLVETQDGIDVVLGDGVSRHRGSLGFRRLLRDGEAAGRLDGKEPEDPIASSAR